MKAIETFMAASDPATLRKLTIFPEHNRPSHDDGLVDIVRYRAALVCGSTQGCCYHATGKTIEEAIDNLDAELVSQAAAIMGAHAHDEGDDDADQG